MQRRAAGRLALLMLPALFWSAVFASLAAGPLGRVPEAAQVLSAVACALAAALVGLGALRGFRH